MDFASLIRIGIVGSIMLLVLALGLRSPPHVAGYLFRRPRLLLRSLLAMNVLMPLITIALVATFRLHPAVKIALVALSISPVPPFLPSKQLRLSSSEDYVYGLFVATALVSVVLVPLTMTLLGTRVALSHHIGAGKVLSIVTLTVLMPLVLGMLVRRIWPTSAERISAVARIAGGVLLVVALVPVLFTQWPSIRSLIGDGTLLAIVAFTLLGLLIGHLLGGPDAEGRTVLALATASRHPGVALAVAGTTFPEEKLVTSAVLLALLVGVIAAAPYSSWRKRVHATLGTREASVPR